MCQLAILTTKFLSIYKVHQCFHNSYFSVQELTLTTSSIQQLSHYFNWNDHNNVGYSSRQNLLDDDDRWYDLDDDLILAMFYRLLYLIYIVLNFHSLGYCYPNLQYNLYDLSASWLISLVVYYPPPNLFPKIGILISVFHYTLICLSWTSIH